VRERGSVLALVPAAVLVSVLLGAIAVDSAVTFAAQRDLRSAALAAANDAATAGVDLDAYHETGAYTLSPGLVRRAVDTSLAASRPTVEAMTVDVDVTGRQVTVVLRAEVALVFASAVPGAPRTAEVTATATAIAVED
jgi:hypothetical protein